MVTVDAIERGMWGATPPATARSQIQADISALRRVFHESGRTRSIVTWPGGYQLVLGDCVLDVDEFDVHVAEAGRAVAVGEWDVAARSLRAALDLWRGPALAGIDSAFTESARAWLEEARLAAVESWAEVELRLGRHRTLAADLVDHVEAHPLREHLRGLRMLALYRSGRQAEALATARDLRVRLADQEGMDPGIEVATLEAMILRNDPGLGSMFTPIDVGALGTVAVASAGPATKPTGPQAKPTGAEAAPVGVVRPRQLPPPVADFTGRSDVCRRLRELLVDSPERPGGVLVCVSGMGGVGKTTLAVRAAHDVLEQFEDGCLFRNLGGTSTHPADPHSVLGTFLRALGVDGARVALDPDERLGQYRSVTAQRRLLIVLDDAADEAQVRPLLAGGPGCVLVVTSRRPLLGLDAVTNVAVTPFDEQGSLSLLRSIVGPRPVDADPGAARRIVALCGGLPLALRIAGARGLATAEPSLGALAGLLADDHRRLAELTAGDRSVQVCFQASLARLPPTASRLFRAVGLHPSGRFAQHEAAVLDGRSLAEVTVDLRTLVDARLVEPHPTAALGAHLVLHDLVRQYARDLVDTQESRPVRDAAVHRLLEFYLDTAHEAGVRQMTGGRYGGRMQVTWQVDEPLRFTDQAEAVAWFDASHDAIVTAFWQAAASGWHADVWRLAFVLRPFFRVGHHTDDWVSTAEAGLSAASHLGDPAAELRLCENLCGAYLRAGRHATCVEIATRATDLARALDDPRAVARSRHLRAVAHDLLGQQQQSEDDLTAALADPGYAASPDAILAWNSLGVIQARQGRHDDCRTAFRTALALAAGTDDFQVLCLIHYNLAELALLTGDSARGAEHARAAIEAAERVRYRIRQARGYELLGDCLAHQDLTGAGRAWQRAITIYEQIEPRDAEKLRDKVARLGRA
jgi:DNA-binding SARP family transcriptional activator/tetratricopeptide (TPR) repeat protein